MAQLQQLTNRLNALDEKRGKYITVSELKLQVFAMTQSFSSAVPAEEQLRQLPVLPKNSPRLRRSRARRSSSNSCQFAMSC